MQDETLKSYCVTDLPFFFSPVISVCFVVMIFIVTFETAAIAVVSDMLYWTRTAVCSHKTRTLRPMKKIKKIIIIITTTISFI